ncbi:MAG: transcriptional regulator [Lacunisphaera sp.]|nr:transcriptional regulator [Lacunisphaera sp.]
MVSYYLPLAMAYPSAELLALSSETRARILQRLEAGPLTVGEIAAGLPVSRPAISQHLRVLEDAKLVTEEYQGTRHIYRIDPTGLVELRAWLDRFWTHSLDAFAAEVARKNPKPSTSHAKSRRSSRH